MTDKDKFIAELYPTAVTLSHESGMSKKLILAQAAQETGWGVHVLAGTHNIFNIKASAEWTGPTKTFKVREIENGKKVWKDQEFRVYGSTEEALRDRLKFLEENPRYTTAGLFDEEVKGVFAKEAAALQKAGYATDPLYAKHLMAVYNGPTMQHALRLVRTWEDSGILKQDDHGAAVHTLQANLAKLGYTDARDHPLKPDGEFGANTRHAVEAFQRDHHLAIDGMVGPQTHAELDSQLKPQNQQSSPSLMDPHHPDHALFRQALVGVHQVDFRMNRISDQHSDNLAGALTLAAKNKGMSRIDEVALQPDGSRAFAAQNHTGFSMYAEVATVAAIHTSLAKSSADALAATTPTVVATNPQAESQEQSLQLTHSITAGLH